MFDYDAEKKKVEEALQQVYRDFAIKYGEIQKSELSESEKQAQISELVVNTANTEEILRRTRSLSELSSEDKEALGIKEESENIRGVDQNVIDTLVAIYAQRARTPNTRHRNIGIQMALTLDEDEQLEEIDTTAFEEELKQYFTEHYYDLLSDGYNHFLSDATEIPDDIGILHNKYGDLTQIAMKHNIDPKKFNCFGYQLTVQDGLVAEEDSYLGRCNILYASPEGLNNRIFDLYSKTLYREQKNGDRDIFLDNTRELKNTYITYAEKNGIQIDNPDVLETIEVDMAKVQGIASYINRIINSRDGIEKGDYTQLFSDDIVRNYSKIMNLQWYNFGNLESVKQVVGENTFIDDLHLKLEEDSITRTDDFSPDIAYGTPEFVRREYQKIMEQVRALHQTNAFEEKYFDVEKITAKKQAYRRYIQENGIEGIDTSIPEVEINHDRTAMIADSIMSEYGKEYEDAETMRGRILAKLEANWAEIVTEAQVMSISKLFGEELKEMGHQYATEHLYVKDDFVYLGEYSGFRSKVIYATQDALVKNLEVLDGRIASRDLNFEDKEVRKALVAYAKEQGFDMNIPSVETVENRGKQEREMFNFGGGFGRWNSKFMPDDPTARPKIKLGDNLFDVIDKMSEGLPGALVGITELIKEDENGFMLLLGLDDMNIRGSQIWEAYKYLYHEDGKKFAQAVKSRGSEMVNFINEELATVGGEKAVTGGASFDRNKEPDKYRFTEQEVEQLKTQRAERIEKERVAREKMLANSPAKKKKMAQKRREERVAIKAEYRAKLMAKGKRTIQELDTELTELQGKEAQAKQLYEQYESQLPNKQQEEEL